MNPSGQISGRSISREKSPAWDSTSSRPKTIVFVPDFDDLIGLIRHLKVLLEGNFDIDRKIRKKVLNLLYGSLKFRAVNGHSNPTLGTYDIIVSCPIPESFLDDVSALFAVNRKDFVVNS